MTKKCFLITLLLLVCAGCTNKELYQAVQQNRVQECQRLPPEQAEKCLKDTNQASYEDYQKKRQAP